MMEQEQVNSGAPGYWTSVLIAGLITGLIYSVVGLISGYMTLNGSTMGGQIVGILGCLIGAVGGIIVNWHYTNENDGLTYKIGKGALLGLLTAVVAVVIGTLFGQIWNAVVDPGMNQALYDIQIQGMEERGMSEEQIEMALSMSPEPGSTNFLLLSVGMGLLALGILNAITGLIGAKIFASEE